MRETEKRRGQIPRLFYRSISGKVWWGLRPEQDAFIESLFRENYGKLRNYAKIVMGNEDLAAELAQDVFHEAVEQIDTLITHPNPRGWLMVVLQNKIRNARRSQDNYIRRFIPLDPDFSEYDHLLATEDVPFNSAGELLREIHAFLEPDEWVLLRRIVIDEQPYKEVSKDLGLSVWACQKRIQRIREKLRGRFPTYF